MAENPVWPINRQDLRDRLMQHAQVLEDPEANRRIINSALSGIGGVLAGMFQHGEDTYQIDITPLSRGRGTAPTLEDEAKRTGAVHGREVLKVLHELVNLGIEATREN